MKNHGANASRRLCALYVTAIICGVLLACSTSQPSNSARRSAARTDDEMRPDRILADSVKIQSAGSFRTGEGTKRRDVDFFLERDSQSDSIPKLQELLASRECTLI